MISTDVLLPESPSEMIPLTSCKMRKAEVCRSMWRQHEVRGGHGPLSNKTQLVFTSERLVNLSIYQYLFLIFLSTGFVPQIETILTLTHQIVGIIEITHFLFPSALVNLVFSALNPKSKNLTQVCCCCIFSIHSYKCCILSIPRPVLFLTYLLFRLWVLERKNYMGISQL